MAIYAGPLNVLTDQSGSVIAVPINPADVPVGFPLIIDVSRLQPPNGNFGYVAGVTVDATAANVAAGIISLAFDGGYNLTRNANGGNTQVYKVSGPCLRVTITNLAWTSGTINVILWNSSPANELQSPLNVVATGTVTISGTPTIALAPGSTIAISSGSVNIGTVTGTVTIEPGAHNLATANVIPPLIGGNQYGLVGSGTNGTIRTIFLSANNCQSFGPAGYIMTRIRNVALSQIYWAGIIPVSNIRDGYVGITNLTLLAIQFTGGLVLDVQTFSLNFVDSQMGINCVVGWN